MITLKAGTSRDRLTDNNVFLQALQGINLALDSGIGKNLGGFLERCSRQERIGCQRSLGDAEQQRLTHRRILAFQNQSVSRIFEFEAVNLAARQVVGIARIENSNLTQHLASNNLDVLVVDVYALGHVHVLNLSNDVTKRGVRVGKAKQVVGIYRTLGELLTNFDLATIGNARQKRCASRYHVFADVAFLVMNSKRLIHLVGSYLQGTSDFSKYSLALRLASLEKLGNTGQTVRNVFACNTAGVERTHRKLRAGLTDGLCSNNTNSGTDVNRTCSSKIPTVALLANAVLCMTGHDRADVDGRDTSSVHSGNLIHGVDEVARSNDNIALGILDVFQNATTNQVLVQLALIVVNRVRNAV